MHINYQFRNINNDVTFFFEVPYGSWFDYELGMEQAEKDHPGLIYTCYYEDVKKVLSRWGLQNRK